MATANSPRTLDPKFKDVPVPDDAKTVENETESDKTGNRTEDTTNDRHDEENEPEGGYIAHTRRWTDNNGKPQEQTDRMPMKDWAAYQKEWDL